MRERIAIHQAMKNEKLEESNLLINSGSELYGACRHKPKFHRYFKPLESCADEGRTAGPEKSLNGLENSEVCQVCDI